MKKLDLTKSKDVLGSFLTFDSSNIKHKYTDEATCYAFRVLEGKQIAGYQLQLACLRHVRDLMRVEEQDPEFPYFYSKEKVNSILTFAKLCPDPDAGKPLPLMPWQKFILCQLIGWRTSDRDDKRFTLASVSVARKQGKTYFAAIILAYSFLLESIGMHNQDFLAAANTSDQTAKLYGYVSDMISLLIEKQPLYREYAKQTGMIVQEKQIIAKKVRNRLVKVSNESGKYDGYHFTTAVYDEAGDEKAGKYTSRITTGQQDVQYHQFIKISTAYEFLGTEFHNGLRRGQEVMEQDWNRESDFELWLAWAQDDENEVYQPETWEKSTPLIGMAERHDSTIDSLMKLRETMITEGKLAEFQNKSMNIYLQDSSTAYLKLADIDNAIVQDFSIDRRPVYIGFDYSMMSDNTGIAFVYPYMENGSPKWHIEQHSFIPWEKAGSIEAKEKQDGIMYRKLAEKGFCTITSHPQGMVNDDQIYRWLMNYVDEHMLDVQLFEYDPYGLTKWAKQLGINVDWQYMPVKQTTPYVMHPTKFLQTAFVEGSITRLDDKVMEKALLNAVIKEDKIGIQVDKDKATLKIDVVDAIIDALYQGMYHFEEYAEINDPKKRVENMSNEAKAEWIFSEDGGIMTEDEMNKLQKELERLEMNDDV